MYIILVILGVLALAAILYYVTKYCGPHTWVNLNKKEVSATEKLQTELDKQTAKLREGQIFLQRKGDIVRRIQREMTILKQDTIALKSRIRHGEDTGISGVWEVQVEEKERTMTAKEAELAAATSDYEAYMKIMEEFHNAIEATRKQAEEGNIELNLAEVEAASAEFQASAVLGTVKDAQDEIQSKVAAAKSKAAANRVIAGRNDAQDALDAEFLKAAEDADKK